MRLTLFIALLFSAITAIAQESQLAADFRGESDRFHSDCIKLSIGSCADLLFTDHPLHIAAGSLAPQNGFAGGLAFVTHYTPNENWRLSWDVDAIASSNGSWRAGGYMKIIRTPVRTIKVDTGDTTTAKKSSLSVPEAPLFNLYAQTISLNKIGYYGLGPTSLVANQTFFGTQQTIGGGNAIIPVSWMSALHLAILGEMNSRLVDIRPSSSGTSIGVLFNDASAPGLITQPGFIQFGEGLRAKPVFFNNHVKLDYLVNFQEFIAPANSTYSFRRFTVDFAHEFPLYSRSTDYSPKDANGPDECGASASDIKCPTIQSSISRNREGSLGLRILLSESVATGGSIVPFYFQQTLGGSDIDGNPALSSYQDYRFRGPDLLLFHESFEHSVWGPLGFTLLADQGKVALSRGDIDIQHFRHSFAAGATIRAGGFPQVYLLFAWAGHAGTHGIASLNTSLLGGSARPSLF